MKKSTILFALAISLIAVSCKKDPTNNTTTSPLVPPIPSTPIPGAATGGALVSLRTFFSFDVSKFSPVPLPVPIPPVDVTIESASASFYGTSTTTLVDAGAVNVNSNSLEKQSNNAYITNPGFSATNYDNISLDFNTGSNWNVAGSGSVTAFSYNYTASFPSYSGLSGLPETITKSSGLTINIGSSNADSIYVAIISGNTSSSTGTVIKRYGPSAGNVTISSADLAPLVATGTDGIAYLEILPFRYTIQSFNTKNYAFVKLAAYVKNVKIQ